MKTKSSDNLTKFGIAILIILVVYGIVAYCSFGKWSDAGVFGDSFGVLNALFSGLAFAGLIVTIWQQQEEINGTKKDIVVSRTASMIYSQLDKIDNAIADFKIIGIDNEHYTGHYSFTYIRNNVKTFYPINFEGQTPEKILNARKEINFKNLGLFTLNDDAINVFSVRLYNATNVVKYSLLNSELSIQEINSFRKIFYDNLGFIQSDFWKEIVHVIDEYFFLFRQDENYLLEIKHLNLASVFFTSVINFKDVILTKENFEEKKEALLK